MREATSSGPPGRAGQQYITAGPVLRTLAALALGAVLVTAPEPAVRAGGMPTCSASAPLMLSLQGGCFALDGGWSGLRYPSDGHIGDITVDPTWLSMTGVADTGFARLAGTMRLARGAETLAYLPANGGLSGRTAGTIGPQGQWVVVPALPVLTQAYLTAGTDSFFLEAGRVQTSLADTADDRPFSTIGPLQAGSDGVRLSAVPALAGDSVRLVTHLGQNMVGLGLEHLGEAATAVAAWRYATGLGTAHLTVLDPDVFGPSQRLGFHAGATVRATPFRFRAALAGDRTGWWNAIASSEARLGRLTLAASGGFLRDSTRDRAPEEFGGGVSATADLARQLALAGGANWVHDAYSNRDTGSYRVGLRMKATVAEEVAVHGEVGVAGDGGNHLTAAPYGATTFEWTPDGGTPLSASLSRGVDGDYGIRASARREF